MILERLTYTTLTIFRVVIDMCPCVFGFMLIYLFIIIIPHLLEVRYLIAVGLKGHFSNIYPYFNSCPFQPLLECGECSKVPAWAVVVYWPIHPIINYYVFVVDLEHDCMKLITCSGV
jgi:hypothetical protein